MKKQIQNKKRSKKRQPLRLATFTVVALFLLQGCGLSHVDPEESCNFMQSKEQQRLSWGENVPVTVHIHKSVPRKFRQDIIEAMEHWNQQMGRTLLELGIEGINGASLPKRDGHSIVYWLNTWDKTPSAEQGRTTVYSRGARIHEADIRINNRDFDFFSTNDFSEQATWSKVHVKSLLIHEFGHFLGLDHDDSHGSVMNSGLASGAIRDHVSSQDIESLSCEY